MNYEFAAEAKNIESLENPQTQYRWAMVAAGMAAVVLAIGMLIFASNIQNRELYHGWYLLGFFIMTGGFGALFALRNFAASFLCLMMVIAILGVSFVKFNYRDTLMKTVSSPDSLLGDYIRELPPLEHTYLPFSDQPKWVMFDKDCFRPLYNGILGIPESCKSKQAIMAKYNINILSIIKNRYALMHSTAKQIEDKTISDKIAYESCIASGGCAEVPLLPPDAEISEMTITAQEHKKIRFAFWEILENEEMDAASCEHIQLCTMFFEAGVIERTDFATRERK